LFFVCATALWREHSLARIINQDGPRIEGINLKLGVSLGIFEADRAFSKRVRLMGSDARPIF
jgi:hypothetical protein